MMLKPDTKQETDLVDDYTTFLDYYTKNGLGYTLMVDDRIIAAAGVVRLLPGSGEAWALVTPLIHRYPIAFFRAVRESLESIILELKLHRVQSTVKVNDKRSVKFLIKLGFEIEGLLRKYSPDGLDHFIMGRVK
jgi:hypothetical protein